MADPIAAPVAVPAKSWPAETKFIGHSTLRVDAEAKLTGRARYASDIQAEGWLYGMVFRSKWPAARVSSVDLSKALQVPGIVAAVAVKEGERTIRFYGEELAAVAGKSKQACLDALRAIEVAATPAPFVVSEDDAKKEGAPQVWDSAPNFSPGTPKEKGTPDAAFAECAAVVEGFYTTPVQIHHPMETHGNTVSWTDEGVTAWASTQGISSVRDGLAGALQLDQSKVRVVTEYMGGGFGAKFGPGVAGILAAKLSKQAKAPVRMMLTRFDQALAVGNRPSSFQKVRLGAKADGTLHAFDYENYGTAGIGAGKASEGGGGGASLPMPYIYPVPNSRTRQSTVSVNAGPASAFRAPGNPPASFAMEGAMDDLAAKLGIDPIDLRLKNDPSPVRRREYELGRDRFGWRQKFHPPGKDKGVVRTGVGCAGASWGGGGNKNTGAEAQINPDGSVELRLGVQDLGTGTRTVIAVIAAEVFGLKPEQIVVRVGDTNFPPGPGSGGSTTCPSISPATYDACTNALRQLQTQTGVDDANDLKGANWTEACRKLGVTPLVARGQWQEGLSSSGAGGVQFAEVSVDTETGMVTVLKVVAVHDCGRVINRITTESQINGGIVIGLGYALYEERVMDPRSGVVLNPNFETYKLPGIVDVPPIDIVLLDMPEKGVIGIGEPATIPIGAAVANAVANALGVRVFSLPITPAKVLAALGKVPAFTPSAA